MERTLLRYLCERFQLNQADLLKHNELDASAGSYRELIIDTRVVLHKCTEISTHQDGLNPEVSALEYPEFVNSLANDGLGQKNRPLSTDSGLTSFTTNLLKSTEWEKLCVAIGRQAFSTMLSEVACFLRPSGNISFGVPSFSKKTAVCEPARKFNMYYGKEPLRQVTRLISQSPKQLARIIVKCGDERRLPKKYRPLINLLRNVKHNDQKFHYQYVLHNLVPQKALKEPIFDNVSPFSQVTRFVFVVVHRLFPNETFGCQKNWNIINQYIYQMLKTDRTETMNIRAVVQKMAVTEISWLGKSPRPTSKQDFLSRANTLCDFVRWLLSGFVAKLISRFWYVTDNVVRSKPSDPYNAFFLHSSWKKLSQPWLETYTSIYLHENEVAVNTNFNCGSLRLIPKKSDFRPLCVPMKISTNAGIDGATRAAQKKAHSLHDYNVMRPIRDILRYQQKKLVSEKPIQFPRCNSVNDVGYIVANFKSALMTKYSGKLPPLFGVQFDMKHCYDNLNQAKILFCIEELFQGESVSEEYIVRKYAHASKSGKRHATSKSLIRNRTNVEEFDVFKHNPTSRRHASVCGDRTRTAKFSRGDVLDLVRSQVIDATAEVPKSGSTYIRKRGVYQGFPLSGTLCDIVYNSLVDNVMVQVKGDNHQCVLLRLADDFLFISTSKAACEDALQRARSPQAKEYGAHVNSEKIAKLNASEHGKEKAHFLGLTIDLRTLSIERAENTIVVLSTNTRRSLKASLAYLDWRFRLRVSEFLLDLKLSDFDSVLQNTRQLYLPALQCAINSTLENDSEPDALEQIGIFIFETLFIILKKFHLANGHSEHSQQLLSSMWQMTHSQFQQHGLPTEYLESLLA